jgi:hypothetical protein
MVNLPSRYLKVYPGPNREESTADFYPPNSMEVNGESFHRQALSEIFRWIQGKPDAFYPIEAFIVQEPENEYDIDALAVYVHEKRVGYIPKNQTYIFKEILRGHFGDRIWVDGAIKYVSELEQFRVRIMVQNPPQLDPTALPFVKLDGRGLFKIYDEKVFNEVISLLPWQQQQVGTRGEVDYWTDAVPALLTVGEGWEELQTDSSEPHYFGYSIDVKVAGCRIATILDKKEPALVKFVKESKTPVLAAISFHANTFSPTYFLFQTIEGINQLLLDPDYIFGKK